MVETPVSAKKRRTTYNKRIYQKVKENHLLSQMESL